MTLPGFHAGASLRHRARSYATGPRRDHGGDLIVPMWTSDEKWAHHFCDQRRDRCDESCVDSPDYYTWLRCHDECVTQEAECLAAFLPPEVI